MSLDELGIKTTTDKSSLFHGYLPFYERIFPQCPDHILEIGVQHGHSTWVWREAYQHAFIVGIDAVDNGPLTTKELDKFLLGNAYSYEMVQKVRELYPVWNIIIDDGSHYPHEQAFVIANYSHLLYQYGVLVVEDVSSANDGIIPMLVAAVPAGFYHAVVDLRTAEKNTIDSKLFLVWKK